MMRLIPWDRVRELPAIDWHRYHEAHIEKVRARVRAARAFEFNFLTISALPFNYFANVVSSERNESG